MPKRRILLIFLIFSTLLLQASISFAQVEPARISLAEGGFLGDYSFSLNSYPSPSNNPTLVWFDFSYDGPTLVATLTGQNTTLDWGSDWYFAHEGDVFGREGIAKNRFEAFIDVDSTGYNNFYQVSFSPALDFINGIEDGPSDFYLGVASGDSFYPRSVFGWVKLQISQGLFVWNGNVVNYKLELLDSRVAYNSTGIIIGTSILVPEPSSLLFGSLCALLLGVRRPR